MRIVHLSDLHLSGGGAWHYGRVDTLARLGEVLASVPATFAAQAVVVSGDISEDDSPESYDLASDVVGEFARGLGVPVLWAPGNHDNTPHYERMHRPDAGHHARGIVAVGQGSVVIADTRTPGRGYGSMPPDFATLLEALARSHGPRVLVQHHPPLPAPTPLHRALRLRGHENWARQVSQADISVVLCGHYHRAQLGHWGTAPVVVAPAIANETVVGHGEGAAERAVARHGAALVDTDDVEGVTLIQLGAEDPEVVLRLSDDQVRRIAMAAGAPDEPGGGIGVVG